MTSENGKSKQTLSFLIKGLHARVLRLVLTHAYSINLSLKGLCHKMDLKILTTWRDRGIYVRAEPVFKVFHRLAEMSIVCKKVD
jgi:hypothetical protein